MSKIEANRAVVRGVPQTARVELSLWSHGTEMTLSMSEEEALQKVADLIQAITENRQSRDAISS